MFHGSNIAQIFQITKNELNINNNNNINNDNNQSQQQEDTGEKKLNSSKNNISDFMKNLNSE